MFLLPLLMRAGILFKRFHFEFRNVLHVSFCTVLVLFSHTSGMAGWNPSLLWICGICLISVLCWFSPVVRRQTANKVPKLTQSVFWDVTTNNLKSGFLIIYYSIGYLNKLSPHVIQLTTFIQFPKLSNSTELEFWKSALQLVTKFIIVCVCARWWTVIPFWVYLSCESYLAWDRLQAPLHFWPA